MDQDSAAFLTLRSAGNLTITKPSCYVVSTANELDTELLTEESEGLFCSNLFLICLFPS